MDEFKSKETFEEMILKDAIREIVQNVAAVPMKLFIAFCFGLSAGILGTLAWVNI